MQRTRLPPVAQTGRLRLANSQPNLTCLCHWRQAGISGMGMKSPDILGAHGCAACHDVVDNTGRHDPEIQLDFARAVFNGRAALAGWACVPGGGA